MYGSYKLKVHNGKLVSVKIIYSERIESVQILGDFFMYPEEAIEVIEKSLIGLGRNSDRTSIADGIKKISEENRITMVGIDPDSMAEAIFMAMK